MIKASQYLLSFNLSIRYKIDKTNIIFDALFKLLENIFEKSFKKVIEKILDVLYEHFIEILDFNFINVMKVKIYHITLIEMSNDFKIRFRKIYDIDEQWKRIFKILRKDLFKS